MLKLCKGFPDAVLPEDHRLPVRPALGRGVQALAHSQGEQRDGGGAVHIAAGQRGSARRTVHMEASGVQRFRKERGQIYSTWCSILTSKCTADEKRKG